MESIENLMVCDKNRERGCMPLTTFLSLAYLGFLTYSPTQIGCQSEELIVESDVEEDAKNRAKKRQNKVTKESNTSNRPKLPPWLQKRVKCGAEVSGSSSRRTRIF